ncbi:TIGR02171 family protein [Fibrobacter sp. UBA4297]|uniref:TIGR02171 family lipoprotein n=1 Tax=Fibrobacter sp. UBA4297 TaxID=1946536 RepID=UPI0025BD3B50|nr:TIGR02171 family protein [Fibrobacter sp. UBA4297]
MKWMLVLVIALLYACTESNSSAVLNEEFVNTVEDSLSGMLRVSHNFNSIVRLGTNDARAKSNEKPELRVKLDYDFSIGKTEVTCREFNKLMKHASGLEVDCDDDLYPATDLTYYDAVLFANERSKAEGLDTVYTYVNAQFDAEKHCTNLVGFVFHPELKGYRLPTETEWVLVARSSWKSASGWVSENSDYKLHKVCSKTDKESAICDMYGNALEWVNDWNGNFQDTLLTNYVGAPDGGALGMRVVKGGCYRNSASTINLYNRGDVYTVTSSTRADYVGFRLAFGVIPNAVWMNANGSVATSRILPLANSTIIRSQAGTFKVKVAFRNDLTGNLAYVDFSSGSPSVVEIEDSIDVYHPEISPNGKKVAFCTNIEGIPGNSALYVRDLNAEGSNLVKLDVESAAIPRWRVIGDDTVIVYVTDAGNNKDESSFKKASTWQVKFANGKFGTPQKLFDGAYHGGISYDDKLAVSGARLLRARIAKTGSTVMDKAVDTVWYQYNGEAEQACNASLARDSSKRTLFLDFGGKTGREFVKNTYAVHELLLVVDSTGRLIHSVAAPEGFAFDHSEWASGTSHIAVATLTNVSGAHSKIVLVNLFDGSIVDLVEGDELWHPSMWIKSDFYMNDDMLLDLDSAGVYFYEGQDWTYVTLGYKMSLLWKYRNDVEILCVGSSRMENGVMAAALSSGYGLNMGYSGNDMNASLFIAQHYGLNHLKKLKVIVVSLDLDLWINSTEYTVMMISKTPGFMYDVNHGFWTTGLPDGFLEAVEQSSEHSEYAKKFYEDSRGFFSDEGTGWGTATVDVDSNWNGEIGEQKVAWNTQRLKDFLALTEPLGIKVVGVHFPLNPGYRDTGSWGRYGPKRSIAMQILDSLSKFQKRYPHFHIFDENKGGAHDYPDECALNTDHLSIQGAAKLTKRLDSLLGSLK